MSLFWPDVATHCFRDPAEEPGERPATLHALRREALHCLSTDEKGNAGAPQAGALILLTGLDLLAQHYQGSMAKTQAAKRFKGFLTAFTSLSAQEQEVLFTLRNSLAHGMTGFGTLAGGKEVWFTLEPRGTTLLRQDTPTQWVVGLAALHQRFDKILRYYRNALAENPDLQKRFMRVYRKVGSLRRV